VADLLVVDTDVLIDAGRGDSQALGRLKQEALQATLGISTVTYLELLVGCRNKREQQQAERFIRRFQVIRLDATISDLAVDLLRQHRLSHGLLIADALIAATALASGSPLLTKNRRDFRFIAGLTLPAYP
jgi:predicted nucleic acid-binding protein